MPWRMTISEDILSQFSGQDLTDGERELLNAVAARIRLAGPPAIPQIGGRIPGTTLAIRHVMVKVEHGEIVDAEIIDAEIISESGPV